MGAFHEIYEDLGRHGVTVLPTHAAAPHRPMVRHPERFILPTIRKLAQNPRYSEANAAAVCGHKSGLAVVDIDSPDQTQLDAALHLFGDTPLVAKTPSGGWHLFYRHAGERRLVRPFGKDCPIDVLGGGLAVLPPSRRPASEGKCAGSYMLVQGGWDDLDGLPAMLDGIARRDAAGSTRTDPVRIEVGNRNNTLFHHLLSVAAKVDDFVSLIDAAYEFNGALSDPLGTAEVKKVAGNVWSYRKRGRLFVPGGKSMAAITTEELDRIGGNSDAALLLMRLRATHEWKEGDPFALANATAETLGWDIRRFKKARATLADLGLIECLHAGGRGPNDPPRYRLPIRGTELSTNTTNPLLRSAE